MVAALGASTVSVLNDSEGVGLEALKHNNVSHSNFFFEGVACLTEQQQP